MEMRCTNLLPPLPPPRRYLMTNFSTITKAEVARLVMEKFEDGGEDAARRLQAYHIKLNRQIVKGLAQKVKVLYADQIQTLLQGENLHALPAKKLEQCLSQVQPPLTPWERDKIVFEVFQESGGGSVGKSGKGGAGGAGGAGVAGAMGGGATGSSVSPSKTIGKAVGTASLLRGPYAREREQQRVRGGGERSERGERGSKEGAPGHTYVHMSARGEVRGGGALSSTSRQQQQQQQQRMGGGERRAASPEHDLLDVAAMLLDPTVGVDGGDGGGGGAATSRSGKRGTSTRLSEAKDRVFSGTQSLASLGAAPGVRTGGGGRGGGGGRWGQLDPLDQGAANYDVSDQGGQGGGQGYPQMGGTTPGGRTLHHSSSAPGGLLMATSAGGDRGRPNNRLPGLGHGEGGGGNGNNINNNDDNRGSSLEHSWLPSLHNMGGRHDRHGRTQKASNGNGVAAAMMMTPGREAVNAMGAVHAVSPFASRATLPASYASPAGGVKAPLHQATWALEQGGHSKRGDAAWSRKTFGVGTQSIASDWDTARHKVAQVRQDKIRQRLDTLNVQIERNSEVGRAVTS